MTDVKFTPNHSREDGMGAVLNSEQMVKIMESVAREIMSRAKTIADDEIGHGREEIAGRKAIAAEEEGAGRKRYKDSFGIKSHRNGGFRGAWGDGRRAEAIIFNDAPSAIFVEFGHRGREPYKVLTRAAFNGQLTGRRR